MRNLILIALIGILTSCNAQQKKTAQKNNSGDLVGIANKESFSDNSYKGWFNQYYKSYQTDDATINELKKSLKGYKIKGFMGTWCGDSKRETPRLYKILEEAGFDQKNLELITVNRGKKTPDNLQEGLNIIKVPTFIFYKNNKEVGRFVERVRESLEKDMLKIVSGQGYKHYYDN
jgi:thiol-disulfide isomerase/thioredoxin